MGMTSKELNVLLQRHGLFADKQALALLKEHVDKSAEPKAEVAAVVQRIKSNTSREYEFLSFWLCPAACSQCVCIARAIEVGSGPCRARRRRVRDDASSRRRDSLNELTFVWW